MEYGSAPKFILYPEFASLQDNLLFYLPFTGHEPHNTEFDVNVNTAGSAIRNLSLYAGALVGRPGAWGGSSKSCEFAQGNINPHNRIFNPSFETDTVNWAAGGGAGTVISRTYEQAMYGSYSLKLVTINPNGSAIFGIPGASCVIGAAVSCSFSVWIYVPAAMVGNTITLGWDNYNGVAFISTLSAVLNLTTAGWSRFSFQGTTPALTTNASPFVVLTNPGTIYIDACQFESLNGYVTPYNDGSLPGGAWTGAAHASTSNRTTSKLQFADWVGNGILSPQQGTAMCWIYLDESTMGMGINEKIALTFEAAMGRIDLEVLPDNSFSANWGMTVIAGTPGEIDAHQWYHLVCTKDALGNFRSYLNGAPHGAASGAATFAGAGFPLQIGGWTVDGFELNGYLDDIATFDRVLTADEIADIYGAGHALGFYGSVDGTCDDATFVTNYQIDPNITNMYWWDSATGTFSPNLMNETPPFGLLPELPLTAGIGDCLYFCIDSALLVTSMWAVVGNVIFELASGAGTWTGTWQYYNGAWVALPQIYDNTNQLSNDGARAVSWLRPNSPALLAINGVTGYWIRFIVTGAGTNVPTQVNRSPYMATQPWIETNEADLGGDIEALLSHTLRDCHTGSNLMFVLGRRCLDRGEDFRAYLNTTDRYQPADIDLTTYIGGVAAAPQRPVGSAYYYTTIGALALSDLFQLHLGVPIANSYVGTYRLYMRCSITDLTASFRMILSVRIGDEDNIIFNPDWVSPDSSITTCSVYFGNLVIPQPPSGYTIDDIYFRLSAESSSGFTLYVQDIALIPSDECIYQANMNETGLTVYGDNDILVADSTNARKHLTAQHYTNDGTDKPGTKEMDWKTESLSPILGLPRRTYRWYLWSQYEDYYKSSYWDLFEMREDGVQRYLSMRGNQ